MSDIYSQDTLKLESLLSIELNGQHNLSAFVDNFDCYHCPTGRVQDNPLYHFAIYLGVTNRLIINDNYSLETGLFAEERNHSGGNNTLSNIVLFPKILMKARDTLHSISSHLSTSFKGGDYWDEDVSDILRLYNIDYHALEAGLHYKNWSVQFMTIGDLSLNVGLDLTQVYRASLGYHTPRLKNVTHVSYNELTAHVTPSDWNISNYTKYDITKNTTLEAQVALRINSRLSTFIAAVIQGESKLNDLSLTYSVRYYQEAFNNGYNGRQPSYRTFQEFVGAQLYPLKNYYRPYSQWRAYTDHQNTDIIGLEIGSKWEKALFGKFYYFHDIDINVIHSTADNTTEVFPFYNLGLNCKFLNQFHGRISLTNKQMELLTFYQTSSASRVPFLSLGVRLQLDDIRLTGRHYNDSVHSAK